VLSHSPDLNASEVRLPEAHFPGTREASDAVASSVFSGALERGAAPSWWRRSADVSVRGAVIAAVALVIGVFAWIVSDLLIHGLPEISLTFLLSSPLDAGRAGGIAPVLVSTLSILGVCLAVCLPLGTSAALLLSELAHSDARLVGILRPCLDVLAGVPSIVFGLFGNAFFCIALGLGFSILSGGLTLACMVLPILIRSTEEGLRSVPAEQRLGAAALGMTRSRTIWRLLLPAAAPGLVVGLVLGIGRAVAETAALIFTSGYVARMPSSIFDSGRALSLHIYDLSMNVAGGEPKAYASALVLLVILLGLISMALSISDGWLSRRWERA